MLTLALGIGASTAMFTVVDGILLQPLPYESADDLFALYRYDLDQGPQGRQGNLSWPDLRDLGAWSETLDAVLGYAPTPLTLTGGERAELVDGSRVLDGPLAAFGLSPALGRDLGAEDAEPGADPTTLVSWSYYRDRLNESPDVLGTKIEISSVAHTVVGVAPPGFDFPEESQLWIPYVTDEGCARGCNLIRSIARRRPGISEEAIEQELLALGARIEAEYPESGTDGRFAVVGLLEKMTATARSPLYLLFGAVGLLFLIAAANVANLLLVHGAGRVRELSIRTAIGATRQRLFRQLLFENGLLAAAASAAGLMLGAALLGGLLALAPSDLPRLDQVGLEASSVAFAVTLATAMLLLFGLVPAWRLSSDALRVRQIGGRSGRGLSRSLLLVAEVALSFMLLFGAGLLLRSFTKLADVELGFHRENVTTFYLSMPDSRYESPDAAALIEALERRLLEVPGVEAVGGALSRPLGSNRVNTEIDFVGRPTPPPGKEPLALLNVVTPGYFDTVRTPLLDGRVFSPGDREDMVPVAIVNQAFVSRFFADGEAVGERINPGVSFDWQYEEPFEIVGVVADSRGYGIDQVSEPEMYFAQGQMGSPWMTVLVRARPGVEVVEIARATLASLDPDLPMREIETLTQAVDRSLGPSRFYLVVLSSFALLALFLAMVGLYGVVAHVVSQRTREIALRMALGADRTEVTRMVLLQGFRPVIAGLALGVGGALVLGRLMAALLYGIAPHDSVTFAAGAIALIVTAAVACVAPARRASAIAPMTVLKEE